MDSLRLAELKRLYKALNVEYKRSQQDCIRLSDEMRKVNLQILALSTGFYPGCVVQDKNGVEYRLSELRITDKSCEITGAVGYRRMGERFQLFPTVLRFVEDGLELVA